MDALWNRFLNFAVPAVGYLLLGMMAWGAVLQQTERYNRFARDYERWRRQRR